MSEVESEHSRGMLAAELSKVRERGIELIDRNTTRQKRLHLPALEEIIRLSPWRDDARTRALRAVVTHSLDLLGDKLARLAVAALYGLDGFTTLTAAERKREGLHRLHVAPGASSETQKLAIRDARLQLADAIIRSAGRGFAGRRPARELVETLPENVRAVLGELEMLRTGPGIFAGRAEAEGPTLIELPGTQDELGRAGSTIRPGEAAIQFLTCAVREPRMQPGHYGLLASMILNLTQTARPYEQRRHDWLAREPELADDAYDIKERAAFRRLAEVACSLATSPCATKFDQIRSAKIAENIFELLLEAATTDLPDTVERLRQLMDFHLPQFTNDTAARLFLSSVPDRFNHLLYLTVFEFGSWRQQYRARIDADALFYLGDLGLVLLRQTGEGRPFSLTVADALVEATVSHFGQEEVRRHTGLDDPREDWPKAVAVTQDAIAWTLRLFSQMLAYNESAGYWSMLGDLQALVDLQYAPQFPVVRIADRKMAEL